MPLFDFDRDGDFDGLDMAIFLALTDDKKKKRKPQEPVDPKKGLGCFIFTLVFIFSLFAFFLLIIHR